MNQKKNNADCIIIGAGIFGLYAAKILDSQNKNVIILERSKKAFARASTINQARVHNGYHYPRSYDTAKKVAEYYDRFNSEFAFAINDSFKHIYAISNTNSKTSSDEFSDFCKTINIPIEKIDSGEYFNTNKVQEAFKVQEPAFDFSKIKDYLISNLSNKVQIIYDAQIVNTENNNSEYSVCLANGTQYAAPNVINATYAGLNEIIDLFDQDSFKLKYELCEVAFCKVSNNLKNLGFTVMDGNFFSIMPFGSNQFHSITSVGHTPHEVSYDNSPIFSQKTLCPIPCKMHEVRNCIVCSQPLKSAWDKMYSLYQEYMRPEFTIEHEHSMFEIKPILVDSEKDDSRPTIIKQHTISPSLTSVFSGKVSTIYDLEKVI